MFSRPQLFPTSDELMNDSFLRALKLRNKSKIPEPDTPSHILSVLNNFCLQTILCKLSPADFLRASQVCKRFKENAKECFPFKNLILYEKEGVKNSMDLKYLEAMLSEFGDSIRSIEWPLKPIASPMKEIFKKKEPIIPDQDILNLINRHCGKKLLYLKLSSRRTSFDPEMSFNALERLDVNCGHLLNFHLYPNLKTVNIRSVNLSHCEWMNMACPTLTSIGLQKMNSFTMHHLEKFLEFNPQIEKFKCNYSWRINTECFELITKLVPNLKEFTYLASFDRTNQEKYLQDLMHICKMKQLKCLAIGTVNEIPGVFFDELVKHGIKIENLLTKKMGNDYEKGLIKMTTLKRIGLIQPNLTNTDIFNLVNHLTVLEHFVYIDHATIRPDMIKSILENAKQLKSLSMCITQMDMTLDEYERILALVKNKCRIYIVVKTGNLQLPDIIDEDNRKWMNIGKESFFEFSAWEDYDLWYKLHETTPTRWTRFIPCLA